MSTLLLFRLNEVSLHRGGSDRIAEAFANGALVGDYRAGDTSRGRHQFNDCLILGMALDQRATKRQLSISPALPFPAADDSCKALQSEHPRGQHFYHNYLHGHTTAVRFLLPLLRVDEIRDIYRLTISALLLFGIAIGMSRIANGRSPRDQAVFLVILLGLSRFFGLEMFGQHPWSWTCGRGVHRLHCISSVQGRKPVGEIRADCFGCLRRSHDDL